MFYLCNFTQSSALFTEVNDNATSTFLCFFHGLFDPVNQVWATRADIRAENITSVTLFSESDEEPHVKGIINPGDSPRREL